MCWVHSYLCLCCCCFVLFFTRLEQNLLEMFTTYVFLKFPNLAADTYLPDYNNICLQISSLLLFLRPSCWNRLSCSLSKIFEAFNKTWVSFLDFFTFFVKTNCFLTSDCMKDEWHGSTFSHCTEMKPKFPVCEGCHVARLEPESVQQWLQVESLHITPNHKPYLLMGLP